MRNLIPIVLAGILASTGPAFAQSYGNGALGLVRSWYEQYLGREPEPSAQQAWVNQLRSGQSPAFVLSNILGSDEYYQRVGNNPEGYVRSLFLDLAGREPSRGEFAYWMNRTNDLTNQEIASALIRRFGVPRQMYRTSRPYREREYRRYGDRDRDRDYYQPYP